MALTSAVAANAANAAAAAATTGAGKKALQVQLQTELNNDDDWNKFIQKEGLLVVDVYSDWCGPCIGMVGNLKKIKVELGGDNLHLAVAKADTIECLKRFRHRSEPTWMFLSGGQLITVVFGADAPRLMRTIEQELKNEEMVRKGDLMREKRAPDELTPQEQEVADRKEKQLQAKKAKEAEALQSSREARREARAKRLETHFMDVCPGMLMPHAQKNIRRVSDALEPFGVVIADKCPLLLTKQLVRGIIMEDPDFGTPAAMAAMTERPVLAVLLKKLPEREGEVIELCRRALFGDGVETEDGDPPKKILAQELKHGAIPGLFIPKDRHQRAAALDLLFPKMVGLIVEPPTPPEPPHVAMIFGAWQRRAVLAAASNPKIAPRVLRFGFFADANVEVPRLLCKKMEQYEERQDKDYCETLVLAVSVGLAEPALADPSEEIPDGPPPELVDLVPMYISEDSVVGADECARFFPPGYSEPEKKAKPKSKKKKKKRHENKEETIDSTTENPPADSTEEHGDQQNGETEDGDGEAEGEGEGDVEGEDEEGEESQPKDKATSPPPQTPRT